MKTGYGIFGKAFEVMLRNDLHAVESVDHALLRTMILLDEESQPILYAGKPAPYDLRAHDLYAFARQFRDKTDRGTIDHALRYCAEIAARYDVPFEDMRFGGTEKEILARGTDWCADMSRVGAVLLQCCGIPARIVHLANTALAYNGHVVVEAFYEGKWGVCDFLYGYRFHDGAPLDAWQLHRNPQLLAAYPADYAGLYTAAAISEYDPMADNDYTVSVPNAYTLRLIQEDHQNRWIMGEDA